MSPHVSARVWVLAVVVCLCLPLSGCGGSKITKENADKVTTGMSEKDVSDILGSPTETAEVQVPNLGGMLGGLMPQKARQSTWKEGPKAVVVTFVDGKVTQKVATGF